MEQPTLREIIDRLQAVLDGQLTREEVADWASRYVMADDLTIHDEIVWDFIQILSGIDLLDSPTSYLHDEGDIHNWIKRATKR
ncbi:MAG: hypothetical protein ABGX20_14750 [Bacillus sp. (in: firmicutes)]